MISEPLMYLALLRQVRDDYQENVWTLLRDNNSEDEKRKKVLDFIKSRLSYVSIEMDGMSRDELITFLYNDICEYSILTPLIEDATVLDVQVNAWNKIIVFKKLGGRQVYNQTFCSYEHYIETVERIIIDKGLEKKDVTKFYSKEINFAIVFPPVFSTTILHITKPSELINTYKFDKTDPVMAMLLATIKYGLSIVVVGSSEIDNKVLTDFLFSNCPVEYTKAAITFNDNEYGEDIIVLKSNWESPNVCEDALLNIGVDVLAADKPTEVVLRLAACGQPTVLTLCACNLQQAYHRMGVSASAFSIAVQLRRTADNVLRITSIAEIVLNESNEVKIHRLKYYSVDVEDVTECHYVKRNSATQNLLDTFGQRGITPKELSLFL